MHRKAIRPATLLEEAVPLADPRQVSADKYPPLLATKIMPPRRAPGLIHRERLLGLVDQVQAKALTVIRAAAGFGKTSLGAPGPSTYTGRAIALRGFRSTPTMMSRPVPCSTSPLCYGGRERPRRTGDQPPAGDFTGPSEHDCRDAFKQV